MPLQVIDLCLFYVSADALNFIFIDIIILLLLIGDMGNVTSTKDPIVEEGDCRYLTREVLKEVSIRNKCV